MYNDSYRFEDWPQLTLGHDATVRIQQLNFIFSLWSNLERDVRQKGHEESYHGSSHVRHSHLLVLFHRFKGLFGKIIQNIGLARFARAINSHIGIVVLSSLHGWIIGETSRIFIEQVFATAE